MKTDIYTKTVLTIIAVCLTWICVHNIGIAETANAAPSASGEPMPVALYAQVKNGGSLLSGYSWVPVEAILKDKSGIIPLSSRLVVSAEQ